jgi:hypothetical protein
MLSARMLSARAFATLSAAVPAVAATVFAGVGESFAGA